MFLQAIFALACFCVLSIVKLRMNNIRFFVRSKSNGAGKGEGEDKYAKSEMCRLYENIVLYKHILCCLTITRSYPRPRANSDFCLSFLERTSQKLCQL